MYLSFIVLLLATFVGRFIQLEAFKNLSNKEKVKVLSKNIIQISQVSLLITLAMVLVFYLLMNKYNTQYKPISIIFFGVILLLRVVTFSVARKNMVINEVREDYMKKYFLSWFVTTVGIIAFVFLTVKPFF